MFFDDFSSQIERQKIYTPVLQWLPRRNLRPGYSTKSRVIFARVLVFVKKIARDHKIYITVLMNKRRGVLVLLFGDFDIPSGSHRIRVFFVYRTTLLQMRFLWNPNLREQTERRAVL